MKKKLKFVVVALIIILLIVTGIRLIKKRKEEIAHLPKPQVPTYIVKGSLVKKGSIFISDDFLGILKPVNTVNISSKISGYIKKIYVKVGEKVQKGQVIALIDAVEIEDQIKNTKLSISNLELQLQALKIKKQAAQVSLQTKENILKRNEKLYEKKAISKEKLEISKAEYQAALSQYKEIVATIAQTKNKIKQLQNSLNSLYNQLSYLKIKSPVDGIVQDIYLREGNIIVPGKPLLSIEDSSKYEILVEVPEKYPITSDTLAIINFNGNIKQLKINRVYPVASKNHLKLVRIVLSEKPSGAISNSYINVSLGRKISGFVVPANSILHLSNGTFLITNQNGIFKKIPIKVLGRNEKYAVVQGNLEEGLIIAKAEESKLRILSLGKKGKILTPEENHE
ncbi:efflux RND transporter periplasmic adaptor subunit [Persephonella sp. IF05-L8]|uniref:efflux RND transporter periplasmic adaptor subunit n=1 Tax=Persephonella sp. IF05-L8 TaxID=1158338 RepID=UPI000496EFA0